VVRTWVGTLFKEPTRRLTLPRSRGDLLVLGYSPSCPVKSLVTATQPISRAESRYTSTARLRPMASAAALLLPGGAAAVAAPRARRHRTAAASAHNSTTTATNARSRSTHRRRVLRTTTLTRAVIEEPPTFSSKPTYRGALFPGVEAGPYRQYFSQSPSLTLHE